MNTEGANPYTKALPYHIFEKSDEIIKGVENRISEFFKTAIESTKTTIIRKNEGSIMGMRESFLNVFKDTNGEDKSIVWVYPLGRKLEKEELEKKSEEKNGRVPVFEKSIINYTEKKENLCKDFLKEQKKRIKEEEFKNLRKIIFKKTTGEIKTYENGEKFLEDLDSKEQKEIGKNKYNKMTREEVANLILTLTYQQLSEFAENPDNLKKPKLKSRKSFLKKISTSGERRHSISFKDIKNFLKPKSRKRTFSNFHKKISPVD